MERSAAGLLQLPVQFETPISTARAPFRCARSSAGRSSGEVTRSASCAPSSSSTGLVASLVVERDGETAEVEPVGASVETERVPAA